MGPTLFMVCGIVIAFASMGVASRVWRFKRPPLLFYGAMFLAIGLAFVATSWWDAFYYVIGGLLAVFLAVSAADVMMHGWTDE